MKKLFVLLAWVVVSMPAFAVSEWRVFHGPDVGPWSASRQIACEAMPAEIFHQVHNDHNDVRWYVFNGNDCVVYIGQKTVHQSVAGIAAYQERTQPVCTPPQIPNPNGAGCVSPPNPCSAKTGIPQTTNWTVGYTRTDGLGSNSDDFLCVGGCNVIPANKMICDAGCTVEQTGATAAWRSTQPTSNGLYRMSLDLTTVPTGGQCSMSDASSAPTNPATPNPTCPGFVGEINGKTTCVGTASQPITGTQADRSTQGAKPGNPAAGEKPATGEGSGTTGAGRTPSTGTGGASGGPASAANGPTGTTTVTGGGGPGVDTVEQAACGAPGQPKCGIDETGTPDGKDALTGKHGEFDDKLGEREAALSTVTSSSGKDTSWGIVPAWTQAGTCTAWHIFSLPPALGGFSVDVDLCPIKPLADGVANFIWVFLAIFAITGMIFKTMTSGGN